MANKVNDKKAIISKHQTLLASHNEQREKEEEQYSGTSCGITI